MVNDWRVEDVHPNAAVDLPVPSNVQDATSPVTKVESSTVADGVWFLVGGSHHSVVVVFDKFLAVIEGPLDEAR